MINFVDWKEKDASLKLTRIMINAIWVGVITGIVAMTLTRIFFNVTSYSWIYLAWCVIVGIFEGLAVYQITKIYKNDIGRAIKPLIWDIRILRDKNERLQTRINELENKKSAMIDELVREAEDDAEIEFIGEQKGDR